MIAPTVLRLLPLMMAPLEESQVPEPPQTPAQFVLRWKAPKGCSSEEAIRARVEALLSGPPRGEGLAEVDADVRRVPGGFELDLTTTFDGQTDVRNFVGQTCIALEDATAVLLAVSLEPELVEAVPAASEPPVPKTQERVGSAAVDPVATTEFPKLLETPASPPLVRASARSRRTLVRGTLGVAAGLEYGALRAATAAIQVSAGLVGLRWRVEATGTYLTPRRGVGGVYQLGAAGVRACWRSSRRALKLGVCGGVEGGALEVESRGSRPARVLRGPFLGPSGSTTLGYRWRAVAPFVHAGLVGRAWGSRAVVGSRSALLQFPVSLRMLGGFRVFLP